MWLAQPSPKNLKRCGLVPREFLTTSGKWTSNAARRPRLCSEYGALQIGLVQDCASNIRSVEPSVTEIRAREIEASKITGAEINTCEICLTEVLRRV
nr:hypothetical protein [Alteripontixanthobacter muriae]